MELRDALIINEADSYPTAMTLTSQYESNQLLDRRGIDGDSFLEILDFHLDLEQGGLAHERRVVTVGSCEESDAESDAESESPSESPEESSTSVGYLTRP